MTYFWEQKIDEEFIKMEDLEDFICPNCHKGRLQNKENIFSDATDEDTILSSILFDESYLRWSFCGIVKCNNNKCDKTTTIAGVWKKFPEKSWDFDETNEPREINIFTKKYKIKYIDPAIILIKIPPSTPELLTEIIVSSFELFWIDQNACWNKVRVLIEKLLDLKRVKKGKTLHARIQLHLNTNELKQNRTKLEAIKWIWNDGSHENNLSRKDLQDVYEILEDVLTELFDSEKKKIAVKVRKIIKKRWKIN